MGRRSRRRPDAPADVAPAPSRPGPSRRTDERPKPPWHPVPLIELCVLAGIVLCVIGFTRLDEEDGRVMLLFGMALASLAGLDTAVREHFAGFRSHSSLLAGLPAVLAASALYFLGAPWPVVTAAPVAVFAGGLLLMRHAFRRRSGGLSFKVR